MVRNHISNSDWNTEQLKTVWGVCTDSDISFPYLLATNISWHLLRKHCVRLGQWTDPFVLSDLLHLRLLTMAPVTWDEAFH